MKTPLLAADLNCCYSAIVRNEAKTSYEREGEK